MAEYIMNSDEFLQAVFTTIKDAVREQKQEHPEDIMSTVTLVTETIYQFVSHTPSEVWFKK